MFLPLGQGVAAANAGFPAVQAGGPPQPAPRAVPQVRREKPILRAPRHRWPRIEVDIRNENDNINKHDRKHRFHQEDFKREDVKPDDVKPDDFKHDDKRDHKRDDKDHKGDWFGDDGPNWGWFDEQGPS
ncbi:hypothetical protein ETD86_49130 [Nonomuraea turkmeniaca]|uniref:Uncharacterized protein n=1 Tax=Nonomuraea turkmeniaca TaxID=103838 RepID=A0A5S4EX91_9ACTN|nr:hypothetical protein [Nonomuraea turkmeniaca]TMR08121.1 hypothetical protein ETD86_49130 [Nonomuraea turkmeniaca]